MAKLTFKKAFTDLQKTIAKMNTKGFADFAFQFVIEGDGAGTFYAACKDEKLAVEPYNYEDNTATFKATAATFTKLVTGEVAPDAAIADGSLVVEGDPACANIFNTIAGKKPAKKTAAKKADTKPAAKKAPAKKAAAAKPAAKKAAPKAAAKKAPAKKAAAAKPAVKAEAKPAEVKPAETKAAEVKPAANKKAAK